MPLEKWERFWRLTSLWRCELREYWHQWNKRHYEYFICDCGSKIRLKTCDVKNWHTKSCWCFRIDNTINRSTIHWWAKRKWHEKLYDIYCWILERCNNKMSKSYQNYWGRWIKCLRTTYEEFKNDMWEWYVKHIKKYWKNTQIDRINNNWNYCKENCRRVTCKENSRNKRNNIYEFWNWEKMLLIDIYNDSNCVVKYSTFMYRYHHWRDLESALFTPVNKK